MWGEAREVSPLQPIGGIEIQREARADFGVIFQFLIPHCALPTSSPPSPACCLKGSCVTPTGVPPSLGKCLSDSLLGATAQRMEVRPT